MNNMQVLKTPLPEDIALHKAAGYFDRAQALIDNYLTRELPMAMRERLTLEKAILEELPKQYPHTFDAVLKQMQAQVPEFTAEELNELKDSGYADWIYVEGEVRFEDKVVANIAKTVQKYSHLQIEEEQKTIEVSPVDILDETIKDMMAKGEKNYAVHIRHTVKVNQEAEELGKTIHVWLPIPQEQDQISNVQILSTSPEAVKIADPQYGQRTVYFEKPLEAGDTFTVEYTYENHASYIDLDPDKVDAEQPNFDTDELYPHIVFTPYIRALADELTAGETNPLIKARKIYDFITTKLHYSYVREYLCIDNIPMYAATGLKGDCGVQALLFITLCRCVGIPAKWQSGSYVNPLTIGNHDWAMFYIAPFGWLHCDCSFGGSAYRNGSELRHNFYFGNLEPFRMSANDQFQLDFDPPKTHLRADPYDNQRGEIEYDDHGLTFHDFTEERVIVDMHEI